MSFKTKPGYTPDSQSDLSQYVPDEEDGVIAYAVATTRHPRPSGRGPKRTTLTTSSSWVFLR